MTTPAGQQTPTTLEEYGSVSRLCSLCSRMCRHGCPTHTSTRSDACSPVGRALIVELYRGGKSAFTEAAVDRLYQCTLCGACKAWCKPKHELPRIIELARERIIQEHRAPQGVVELDRAIAQTHNVYGEPHNQRFAALSSPLRVPKPDAEVLYFVGCTTAYRHPEIAEAAAKVLEKLGVAVHIMTGDHGEVCCGSPLIRAGAITAARELAQQNATAVAHAKVPTIVTTCPGCARALKLDYPLLGVSLPENARVLHITEFLVSRRRQLQTLLTQRHASARREELLSIIYHDPCHLGRELGVYDAPRQLLKLLPDVHLLEFTHNREHADCCGGGGALPKTFPNLATDVGVHRVTDAAQSGARYLASCCPNCKQHFAAVQGAKTGPKPVDLVELLAGTV
jgi:heterodisulfide reductase subunit D